MKTLKFETKEEWLLARRGRITGSRLKDIVVKRGTGYKIGFYELIAEKLGIPADDESAMDRGTRLECEALDMYEQMTGEKLDRSLVIWTRDDNENIAVSPDGFVANKKKITKAAEAKCLSSARHIEAWLTKQIPDEYEFQKLQYFITNEDLETLVFAFYDPRLLAKPFFMITVHREDIQEEVDQYLGYQKKTLEEVNKIVNDLTF